MHRPARGRRWPSAVAAALGVLAAGPAAAQPLPPAGPVVPPSAVLPAVLQTPTPSDTVPPPVALPPTLPPAAAGTPSVGGGGDAPAPTPSDTVQTGVPLTAPEFEVLWNSGLFFQTRSREFVLHIGGIVDFDAAWYAPAPQVQVPPPAGTGPLEDGVFLRRGRVRMEGVMYRNTEFVLEFEFANANFPANSASAATVGGTFNTPSVTEGWVTLTDVPAAGNVRIGFHKEWFSLEHLTSDRFQPFMERSYLFDMAQTSAFNNGFSPGVSGFRTWADKRLFTGGGVYKNISDPFQFGVGDGEYAATGRVGWTAVYRPEDQRVLWVGGAASRRDPVGEVVQVRAREQIRNAPGPLLPGIATSGNLLADSHRLFNVEAAAVYEALSLMAEYQVVVVDGARAAGNPSARPPVSPGPPLGDLVFPGAYAQALYFLTGETRTWSPDTGTFNRVVPLRNYKWGAGPGAWEVGARYSFADLTTAGVQGGRLNSLTLGLNWYLNPNVRLMCNYDYTYRDEVPAGVKGQIHAFGTRMHLDF